MLSRVLKQPNTLYNNCCGYCLTSVGSQRLNIRVVRNFCSNAFVNKFVTNLSSTRAKYL